MNIISIIATILLFIDISIGVYGFITSNPQLATLSVTMVIPCMAFIILLIEGENIIKNSKHNNNKDTDNK